MARNADVAITCDEFDARWAEKLRRDLRTAGFEVVIGNADFDALASISSAQHLVLLWSRHAAQSERVRSQRESFLAAHGDSPDHLLIQVWLDDTDLPYPELHAVSGLRDAHAYDKGADVVEPLVWNEAVRQITTSLRSRKSDVPLGWLETSSLRGSSNASPRQTVVQGGAKERVPATVVSGEEDYAIVIGVSSYLNLNNLPSAASDARAFVEWLEVVDGGAISQSRIALRTFEVESKTPAAAPALVECFEPLAKQVLEHRGERIGRRLYLFASGRGTDRSVDDLAMCAPGASEISFQAIRLKAFADWFMNSGAFEEVVLFADCRPFDTLATVTAAPPPFVDVKQRFNDTALFYCASRTVRGSPDSERTGVGSFTQAVLERLRGEVAEVTTANGVVSSHAFTRQLSERVAQLSSGTQDVQYIVHGAEIVLRPGAETPRSQVETSRPQVTKAAEERVAAHADNPALVDELGRRPFAEVIAQRIDEVRRATRAGDSHEAGAFVINLHGPWGSGKTSVLNFLKENLQDKKRKAEERWVVIEFNAWRHQRLQPPWWILIKQIYEQALEQLRNAASDVPPESTPESRRRPRVLRARWFWWRFRADWLPVVATVLLVAIALIAIYLALVEQGGSAAGDSGIGKVMELGLGVIATGGALVALSRSLLFGSATAAQAYMDGQSDPLDPIVKLFEEIVTTIERPLVVFIDDLDRCDGSYVIALLEGIQTMFRTRPVTYVIAADRKWICSCFEKRYSGFSKAIGEPGRPLGYLFLDKVFQVSASVPRVSTAVQRTYWQSLLRAGASTQRRPAAIDEEQREEQSKAELAVKDVRTLQEGDRRIEEAKSRGAVAEQAMRAAVAKQITSPEAMQETEHRLQPFAHLLEANPRAMKRLVNAYGLYQAAHILERRQVSPEALARWTIVELRWPLLAEQLASRPQFLNGPSSTSGLSKPFKSLLEECEVKAVLTGTPPEGDVLDEDSLRRIVGSTEEPRLEPSAAGPPEGGHYEGV